MAVVELTPTAFALPAQLSSTRLSSSVTSQGASARSAEDPVRSPPSWSLAAGGACAAMVVGGSRMRRRVRAVRNPRANVVPTQRRVATLEKTEETVGNIVEREDIRNLAIIAHVDHGKTTLTDALMKQCGQEKLASMDSDAQEMERGITILAKNAAIKYKDVKINLIDTPGHADFGGEVERILNMADACLLLVDAQEGPMPQTKFVLRKALELQKRVLLCINKVDKPMARPDWVLDNTFDLFVNLGADDYLCEFPVCYASGIQGKSCVDDPTALADDLTPMLDQILAEVPKPKVNQDEPLQMLVANLDYDDYLGRISIGRVTSGNLKVGQDIGFMYGEDGEVRKCKIKELFAFQNNDRVQVEEVQAGDICGITGMADVTIGDTIVDIKNPKPLPPIKVEEPTIIMDFMVSQSPFKGKEGTQQTGSLIKKRLEKECMTNLAVRVEAQSGDNFTVKGRGMLQLGVLIENMRREGFEMMIGAPQVVVQKDPETGKNQQPVEEATVEVPSEYQGVVMQEFQSKGGTMLNMETGSIAGSTILQFEIPTANLIGMQASLMQQTSGTATMNSQFSKWGDMSEKAIKIRSKGSIITTSGGPVTTYALDKLQQKGDFWVKPGEELFEGMCVGIHVKQEDVSVNVCKVKQVSNVRVSGAAAGGAATSIACKQMTLDDMLGHMDTDEMLEVTPKSLRLCKKNAKGLKK